MRIFLRFVFFLLAQDILVVKLTTMVLVLGILITNMVYVNQAD